MKGSQESRDLVAYVGNIFLSLEERLLSVTYLLIGASAGFIHGSIKAGHKLQHNFTSADGLRELWLGSKHIGEEKDTRSFKDLLTSWVPWPQGSTKPANGLPALESDHHVHTNGVATESEPEPVSNTALPAKPLKEKDVPEQCLPEPGVPGPVVIIKPPDAEEEMQAPVPTKSRKKLADMFAIKRHTTNEEMEVIPVHQVASTEPSFATTNSGTSTDDSALTSGPPTRTVSWDREGICSDAEAEHAGDAGKAEDGKHKKRRKIFKKLGKKVKKAFEPLTHSRTSSPKKA